MTISLRLTRGLTVSGMSGFGDPCANSPWACWARRIVLGFPRTVLDSQLDVWLWEPPADSPGIPERESNLLMRMS
jgi:hypothetical protein